LFFFGYAVVRPTRHDKYAGEWVPHVVEHNKFQLHFISTSQRPRRYLVEYLDCQYPMITLAELLRQDTPTEADPPPKKSRTIETAPLVSDPGVTQFQANENNGMVADSSRFIIILLPLCSGMANE
jgi:hypothetical protein